MFDIREAIVVLLYDEDIYKHCEQHCYCPTDKELQGQQEAKKKAEMTRGRVIRTSLPGNGKYQGGNGASPKIDLQMVSNRGDSRIGRGKETLGKVWVPDRRPEGPAVNTDRNLKAAFGSMRVGMA
jgi:hypothetical protein